MKWLLDSLKGDRSRCRSVAASAKRRKVFALLRLHGQTSMTMLILTLNQPEKIVNIKFAALATTFLLTTGCAMTESGSTSAGSSATGTQQASSYRPAGRTRAEVHAEAVEAVKHYVPTQQEERDFFNPYANPYAR